MDEEEGAGTTFHVCVYICVHISPHGGNGEKPRKIPQTGDNPWTQSYPEDESLGIAKGSSVTVGREWAGEVAAHRVFRCRAPLGFRCQVLADLEQVLGLFMIFMYSSCSADHRQGEFSC